MSRMSDSIEHGSETTVEQQVVKNCHICGAILFKSDLSELEALKIRIEQATGMTCTLLERLNCDDCAELMSRFENESRN